METKRQVGVTGSAVFASQFLANISLEGALHAVTQAALRDASISKAN